MKKLLLIFIFCSLFNAPSIANENLIPLKEYIKNHDLKTDDTPLYYFSSRCASLFFYLTQLMNKPGMEEVQKKYESMAGNYYLLALSIGEKSNKEETAKKDFEEIFNKLTDIYTELGNQHYISRGTYSSELHFEDNDACTNFYPNL